MQKSIKPFLILGLVLLVSGFPDHLVAWGERKVAMKIVGPDCGLEVSYRRSWDGGRQSETYAVHAEKLTVNNVPAYQSISVYKDRVRRITMRQSDLTPLVMIEKWSQGPGLIQRTYQKNQVHVVRRGVPYPMDLQVEVPPGVHDPESFAFLLRGYPFARQNTISPINVLMAEPNPIITNPRALGVYIIPHGAGKVKVPAGVFDCYILEMTLSSVLGYVVPNNRFWLLKNEPHLIVKAEGGGQTIELMAGPFACDGNKHCPVRAEVPKF